MTINTTKTDQTTNL